MNKLCALFAYGTLKPGEEAQHYLNQITRIWYDVYIFGRYVTNLSINYPAIQLDPNGKKDKR